MAVESGVVPVAGRGLRIELTDAPTDDPDTQDPTLRVQDVDLQVVVNGLWAAGAEAIAVNGHRLTSMTAIRSAGDAVLVDLVPLSSPYKVDAIGDPVAMQPALARIERRPAHVDAPDHLRDRCADVVEGSPRAPGHGSGDLARRDGPGRVRGARVRHPGRRRPRRPT